MDRFRNEKVARVSDRKQKWMEEEEDLRRASKQYFQIVVGAL